MGLETALPISVLLIALVCYICWSVASDDGQELPRVIEREIKRINKHLIDCECARKLENLRKGIID